MNALVLVTLNLLLALVSPATVPGAGPHRTSRTVNCASTPHCQCDVSIEMTVVGTCKNGAQELKLSVTVTCGPTTKCTDDFVVCGDNASPLSMKCGAKSFTIGPNAGSTTWGGVFAGGSCAQLGVTCG